MFYWHIHTKYDAQRGIFGEIRGVWITDETLSGVFDISPTKLKLRGKRRSKIVKICFNEDRGTSFSVLILTVLT